MSINPDDLIKAAPELPKGAEAQSGAPCAVLKLECAIMIC